MEDLNWLISLLGIAVTLLISIDVILTVLHIDTEGPVAWVIFQSVWRVFQKLIRLFPRTRRTLVALAGPVMIVATFAVWIGIFVVGFALIYYPYIGLFRADEEFMLLGFYEALYFSGVTATVLGYGDITPVEGVLQIVSILQSALGFALLTGIVTYLINVVTGVSDRNALALRLWSENGQTGDGTNAVIRSLSCEKSSDLRLRLQTLLDIMYNVHQKIHQFPILNLFYRSKDPIYSPELMVRSAMQLSVAARVISADEQYRRLRAVSDELAEVTTMMMGIIASQHMMKKLRDQLDRPDPGEADERYLEQIVLTLGSNFPRLNLEDAGKDRRTLELVFRLCSFLDETDKLTGWRMDDTV
ncbi:MAG: potassium channel family protein, partial [Balneolaceae bacterium]